MKKTNFNDLLKEYKILREDSRMADAEREQMGISSVTQPQDTSLFKAIQNNQMEKQKFTSTGRLFPFDSIENQLGDSIICISNLMSLYKTASGNEAIKNKKLVKECYLDTKYIYEKLVELSKKSDKIIG